MGPGGEAARRGRPLSLACSWSRVTPSMTSRGSITLPRLLDILRPWASRTMLCRYTVWNGSLPALKKYPTAERGQANLQEMTRCGRSFVAGTVPDILP